MQEHTNKDPENRNRRTNPIHIVEGSRTGISNADALRDVHMSLVRAEQNLYNLVQANHAAGAPLTSPPYGFGVPTPYAAAYAGPGFAPGFGPGVAPPTTIPTPNGFPFGVPTAPWTQPSTIPGNPGMGYGIPTAPWTPQTVLPSWSPLTSAFGTAPVGWTLGPAAGAAFAPLAGRFPACDISDEGKQFVCQLDLPGLQADQVELLCFEHGVVINAFRESEVEPASIVQAERGITPLQRTIRLPDEILPAGVKATLSNGVLSIVLPKAHPTEGPRRVKVQG